MESDIIGCIGGDEFAVLAIDKVDDMEEMLVARLKSYLNYHNKLDARDCKLSLSPGIAHYKPEKPSSLDELIAQTDTLMYQEKKRKQN